MLGTKLTVGTGGNRVCGDTATASPVPFLDRYPNGTIAGTAQDTELPALRSPPENPGPFWRKIMKNIKLALASLTLALPLVAAADDRPLQVVAAMIEINAKPDKVWNIVKDFDGLHHWHPAFSATPLIKGRNGKRGAVRELAIKDGPKVLEELVAYEDARMAYTYAIVDSPLPLDHYQSSMAVHANGSGGTTVSWIGTFTRKDPRDNPDPKSSDSAAVDLIVGAYQAGLDTVKKMAEGK